MGTQRKENQPKKKRERESERERERERERMKKKKKRRKTIQGNKTHKGGIKAAQEEQLIGQLTLITEKHVYQYLSILRNPENKSRSPKAMYLQSSKENITLPLQRSHLNSSQDNEIPMLSTSQDMHQFLPLNNSLSQKHYVYGLATIIQS